MAAHLEEMRVFTKVVAAGSLSAAARELGSSPAVISRTLAALESRLGVRLVNRTTRRLHLTEEGAGYLDACTRILADLGAGRSEPRGVLRVAIPASFGHQHIAPLVPAFVQRYPQVRLALSLSDRAVSLIEEGYDVAIRIAELEDSSLAARKLAPNRRVICASPSYLARHGTPRTPEDLLRHDFLMTTSEHDFSFPIEYRDPAGAAGSLRVTGRYACDHWSVLRDWAVAGLGLALKSTWHVRRHLEDGSLVALLPGYTFDTDVAIYAVYPHRRHLPARTRAFIDFLAESFGPEPYWDRPVMPGPAVAETAPKPRIKARASRLARDAVG